MKEVRNLLLDCRTALRQANPDFEDTPLGERLDQTLVAMAQAQWSEQAKPSASQAAPPGQRVAYAWQAAARELRRSHPELHKQLSEQVLKLLDDEVFDDPTDEIEALQQRLRDRESQLALATGDLASLCSDLAVAVPLPGQVSGSDAELARKRVQLMAEALARGGGLPKPDPGDIDTGTPSRELLQAVAAGKRSLSTDQLEWCLGEAMVLTGFEQNREQLLAQGAAALAQRILAGTPEQG